MKIQDAPPSPKLFRCLIHHKAAVVATYISEEDDILPLDALRKFYLSQTYKQLENETTKCWWESPAQIYRDYCREH
jgi:hypothetical protein